LGIPHRLLTKALVVHLQLVKRLDAVEATLRALQARIEAEPTAGGDCHHTPACWEQEINIGMDHPRRKLTSGTLLQPYATVCICCLQVPKQQGEPSWRRMALATAHRAAVRVECMQPMQLHRCMCSSKASSTGRRHHRRAVRVDHSELRRLKRVGRLRSGPTVVSILGFW
jgi:hypothetical protein